MANTITKDLSTIYSVSREVYAQQPLLKHLVWRRVKLDILQLATGLGFLGMFFWLSPYIEQSAVRYTLIGALVAGFVLSFALVFHFLEARLLIVGNMGLRGEAATHQEVEAVVRKRRKQITQWVFLDLAAHTATSLLGKLDEKVPFLGTTLSLVSTLAWQVASFFAFPIVVFHGEGPFAALKQSTGAVHETWKAGRERYGKWGLARAGLALSSYLLFITLLAVLILVGISAAVVFLTDWVVLSATTERVLAVGGALLVLPLVAYVSYIMAVIDAHFTIWQVAVYRFAVHKDATGLFPRALLEQAIEPVEKRRWFSRSKPA